VSSGSYHCRPASQITDTVQELPTLIRPPKNAARRKVPRMVSTKFKMVLRNNVIALPVINRQRRLLTQHLYVQALDIGVFSDMPSHMIDALLTPLDEKVE